VLCVNHDPGCFHSKKEQTQNPNAVLSALKTYDRSIRYKGKNKFMAAESLEDITESGSESRGSSTGDASSPESPLQEPEKAPTSPSERPPMPPPIPEKKVNPFTVAVRTESSVVFW